MMNRVIGVDLSLTSTGLAMWSQAQGPAHITGGPKWALWTVRTEAGMYNPERWRQVTEQMWPYCGEHTLWVLEGRLDIPMRGPTTMDLSEQRGAVLYGLHIRQQAVAIVRPTPLKKFATSRGGADKQKMIAAAYEQLAVYPRNGDEADAVWLATVALTHYGVNVFAGLHSGVTPWRVEVMSDVDWPKFELLRMDEGS